MTAAIDPAIQRIHAQIKTLRNQRDALLVMRGFAVEAGAVEAVADFDAKIKAIRKDIKAKQRLAYWVPKPKEGDSSAGG